MSTDQPYANAILGKSTEKNTVKDSTEKAAPVFCDRCRPVKHYDVAVAYVDVELCPTHRAAPSLYAALASFAYSFDERDKGNPCWCYAESTEPIGQQKDHLPKCQFARAALALIDGQDNNSDENVDEETRRIQVQDGLRCGECGSTEAGSCFYCKDGL